MGRFKWLLYIVYGISSQICDIFGNMRTSECGRSIDFGNRMEGNTNPKVCPMHQGHTKTNTLTFTYIDLHTKYI